MSTNPFIVEIGTAQTVGSLDASGTYRPALDVTMVMTEDSFLGGALHIRATRVVSQEVYDDREGRLVIEMLVKNSLIGACGSSQCGEAILAWLDLGNDEVRRPAASWKPLGGQRVAEDGSTIEPPWIYACGYEIPRDVLMGVPQTAD